MRKFTSAQIRSSFLDYFASSDHTIVQSSPLVPHNDPSLMFVNSGMVQFKNVFTGLEARDYTRAVSSQKSVRAGGKHNDLENVGYTARHHTFFEMLGNFSFGDYFKEQAIFYAWNFLTKELALPKDKLYVTIFHTDEEAYNLWQRIAGLGDDRIIKIKTNDNFWSMGDTGPCGPCSEIFFDHGEHIAGGLPGAPDEDGDRFIEIWNLVFMQYEQIDRDTRIELPKQSVDTGMGLERISAVLQNVHNNYDTDIFKEIMASASDILQIKPEGEAKFSYRVIADHLRSCSFLIADGVMPSNEGRGYVLRRIMRRGMRHAHQLGAKEPVMYKLLPKLVDLMGNAYPELKRGEDFISDILKQEEIRFKSTLERGLKLLDDEVISSNSTGKLSGEVAFKLYDTYGFPLDLTQDILKNKQIEVDISGFEQKMAEQKSRAKASWTGSGAKKADDKWFELKTRFGSSEFLGYSLHSAEGIVLDLIRNDTSQTEITNIGDEFILVANQTPFYGESGGQMGDTGIIENNNCRIKVIDTTKYLGSIHAHICILESGKISNGDTAKFIIDEEHRRNLRANHSATHILHSVLREVLGSHVTQKGSLVAHDRLRFDISHPKALSLEEIKKVQQRVNNIIFHNSKINTVLMSSDEAINSGAMALFGEKYDAEVRVVSMGIENIDGQQYSVELCGGTHASRTGDIGCFKIISESAIGAGVRRIEAICGIYALELMQKNENTIEEIAAILKASKNEVVEKVELFVKNKKELERELQKFKTSSLSITRDEIDKQNVKINDNAKLIYKLYEEVDAKLIRTNAEQLARDHEDLIVVLMTNSEDKLSIVVAVSSAIGNNYHAGNIARELSLYLDGKGGGGTATLAQAGGIKSEKLEKLQSKIEEILRK